MKHLIILLLLPISVFASKDAWRLEIKVVNDLDTVSVYSTGDKQSDKPLAVLTAPTRSQGFKTAEEIYIKSLKKRYLITRWVYGVTGSETLRIIDPESPDQKEVYVLRSMPTDYKIKADGVVFSIPTSSKTLKAEWKP